MTAIILSLAGGLELVDIIRHRAGVPSELAPWVLLLALIWGWP